MSNSALTILPFEPSAESYRVLAALWNRLQNPWPRDPVVWARIDARASEPTLRHLAWQGGALVGAAQIERSDGSALPNAYSVTVFVDDTVSGASDLAGTLHDGVVEALGTGVQPALFAYVGDDQALLMTLYRERAYRTVNRAAYGRLDLASFDAGRFADRMDAVCAAGYTVCSLESLSRSDPKWIERMHSLHCAILSDVPADGGFAPPTLESFTADLANPDRFSLGLVFVAVQRDVYVASSQVMPMTRKEDGGFCSLSGTRRMHRRKGLCFATKVALMKGAQDLGLASLTTLNEIDNPMRALNDTLGFETQYIQHTLRLDLDRASSS